MIKINLISKNKSLESYIKNPSYFLKIKQKNLIKNLKSIIKENFLYFTFIGRQRNKNFK